MEEEVRRQRRALLEAVNRHDLEAVRGLIHPSYTAHTGGIAFDYGAIMGAAERMLRIPDYTESVEIEAAEVDGETARLTTRRTDRFTGFLRIRHEATTRQIETWRKVDGRWMLTGEEPI